MNLFLRSNFHCRYGGFQGETVRRAFTSRYSYLEGKGACGTAHAFHKAAPYNPYPDFLPLQLYPKL